MTVKIVAGEFGSRAFICRIRRQWHCPKVLRHLGKQSRSPFPHKTCSSSMGPRGETTASFCSLLWSHDETQALHREQVSHHVLSVPQTERKTRFSTVDNKDDVEDAILLLQGEWHYLVVDKRLQHNKRLPTWRVEGEVGRGTTL